MWRCGSKGVLKEGWGTLMRASEERRSCLYNFIWGNSITIQHSDIKTTESDINIRKQGWKGEKVEKSQTT